MEEDKVTALHGPVQESLQNPEHSSGPLDQNPRDYIQSTSNSEEIVGQDAKSDSGEQVLIDLTQSVDTGNKGNEDKETVVSDWSSNLQKRTRTERGDQNEEISRKLQRQIGRASGRGRVLWDGVSSGGGATVKKKKRVSDRE